MLQISRFLHQTGALSHAWKRNSCRALVLVLRPTLPVAWGPSCLYVCCAFVKRVAARRCGRLAKTSVLTIVIAPRMGPAAHPGAIVTPNCSTVCDFTCTWRQTVVPYAILRIHGANCSTVCNFYASTAPNCSTVYCFAHARGHADANL